MKIFIFIIFCTILGPVVQAEDLPVAINLNEEIPQKLIYGDVFIGQSIEPNQHKLNSYIQYSSGTNSPQYSLTGANLGSDYWLLNSLMVGMSLNYYSSSPLLLQEVLSNELRLNAVSLKYYSPKFGIYAHLGYVPLQGIFNLFEKFVIKSSLIVGLGLGTTQYSDHAFYPGIKIFIEERLLLYKTFGISLGITHFWEGNHPQLESQNTHWLSRDQVVSGVYLEL